MNQISFTKARADGQKEIVKFTEGDKFEFNGVVFRIAKILEKGKMVIKPAL